MSKDPDRPWTHSYWFFTAFIGRPLKAGETTSFRFVVDPERRVRGRAVDGKGNGVRRLKVSFYFRMVAPGVQSIDAYSRASTAEDGTFELSGVGNGPYRASLTDPASGRRTEFPSLPEGEDFELKWDSEERPPSPGR